MKEPEWEQLTWFQEDSPVSLYLWPEMLRVIRELTPRCVVGENVPGILRIAAADVVKDLERAGYHVVVFDFEAAAVGALHRRERVAFVAYAVDSKRDRIDRREQTGGFKERCVFVSDTDNRSGSLRRDGELSAAPGPERIRSHFGGRAAECVPGEWWAVEPDVGRVAHGVPNRVDRLKCLGNAVVPQQFYPIFKAIMEVMEDA